MTLTVKQLDFGIVDKEVLKKKVGDTFFVCVFGSKCRKTGVICLEGFFIKKLAQRGRPYTTSILRE